MDSQIFEHFPRELACIRYNNTYHAMVVAPSIKRENRIRKLETLETMAARSIIAIIPGLLIYTKHSIPKNRVIIEG